MGQRGPMKAPTKLRLINGRGEGRDSGGRKVEKEIGFERDKPRMPSYLPEGAKTVWKSVVETLDGLGILKKVDGPSLEAYCTAVWQMRESMKQLLEEGMTVETSQGVPKPHPAVAALKAARADVHTFARDFGLNPAAEGQIQGLGEDDGDQEANPFAIGD
ncbi:MULTISPECIES: phage terminase small subunit P27 family [Bifidobacterium]|nr:MULTISPECIES: phage terminase small subunit P27 family [Bifidobacterium]RBQ00060.1 phage terminase small subunit P27 family [Bifidobacterium xylocopae]